MHRALPGTLQCADCVRSCVHSRGSRLAGRKFACRVAVSMVKRRRTNHKTSREEGGERREGRGRAIFQIFQRRRGESPGAFCWKRPLGFFSLRETVHWRATITGRFSSFSPEARIALAHLLPRLFQTADSLVQTLSLLRDSQP